MECTSSYDDLFERLLLHQVENSTLTDIKLMLEAKVESLTKMVVDRNTSISRLSECISKLNDKLQNKGQELQNKEKLIGKYYDRMKQSDVSMVLTLQQQKAEIYEASKEWVYLHRGNVAATRQTIMLLNKLTEVFSYDIYTIDEKTNEWVSDCKKRNEYDDSQGQTPPGYVHPTPPSRETFDTPKQSYDYRKVGLQ